MEIRLNKEKVIETGLLMGPLIVDQGIKFILKGLRSGTLVTNKGIILGVGKGWGLTPMILNIVSIIVAVFFQEKFPKYRNLFLIMISASLSNLIDRILFGGVIDYIKIWKLPTFNLADIFIATATFLIMVQVFIVNRGE